MKNLKKIAMCAFFAMATICANAQQSVQHVSYTGNHCWLAEVRASALFDKAPLTGESQTEAGAFGRVSLFKRGWFVYAEGGYQRNDFAGYIGGGVKLAPRTWRVQPVVEAGIGIGNQYCGYNYEAAVHENTENGKIDIQVSENYLDSKIKPQARLALNLEVRCSDRVSLVGGIGGVYRFSEAKTLEPNGSLVVNGHTIDAKTGAIGLKTNKFVCGATLGVVLRIL